MWSRIANLRQLVLPSGASGKSPRIVLGPDVPALIKNITIGANTWAVSSAIIGYLEYPTVYHFDAVAELSPDPGPPFIFARITGYVTNNTVKIIFYETYNDTFINNTITFGSDTFVHVPGPVTVDGLLASGGTGTVDFSNGGLAPGGKLTLQQADYSGTGAAGGNTTSAAYANAPGSADFTFIKKFDGTNAEIDVDFGCWASGTGATVWVGVNIAGPTSVGDVDVVKRNIDVVSSHVVSSRTVAFTGTMVAGTYTCRLRWKRNAGTGTLQCDTNDFYSVKMREVAG